jgi:hypothetical protein
MIVIPVLIFDKNSRSFVAEMLAPWQHCLSGYRVLIGKCMQLEKTETTKSIIGTGSRAKQIRKNTLLIGKSLLNCGMHFEMRSRQYTHLLNFVYKDDIKIKNNYFATV